jgi:malonyl-CoA/methylmalonyl-CoA synthetase
LSVFDVAPTGYDRLAEYFDKHIATLPSALREIYIQEIVKVRVAGVSGSLLPPHTQSRWTELRKGKPLLNLYGSTEVTLICSMRWDFPEYSNMVRVETKFLLLKYAHVCVKCCIGEPVPGVKVKLVNGEMRLKAPTMFSRYVCPNEKPTNPTDL